jgi:hypothetical protein
MYVFRRAYCFDVEDLRKIVYLIWKTSSPLIRCWKKSANIVKTAFGICVRIKGTQRVPEMIVKCSNCELNTVFV